MLSFECDYNTGCHPKVLERLCETNLTPMPGYGTDEFCESAKRKILAACGCPGGEVQFLVGGTQTNAIVISSMLHRYEGVIAADTGHIAVHEAGAIEFTGHKVLTLPEHDGKIDPAELRDYLCTFYADANHDHCVFPGMVYISHPTEYGTLYTKSELTALHEICGEYKIPLFMDGARLGYGLASPETDVTLTDIAALTDVFYIGGTKVGALCGEAVVFPEKAPPHFMTMVKQQGALLAKGRLLGVQFDALFTDDLYMEISRRAIRMTEKLKELFQSRGYTFFRQSPTNQQFVVLTDEEAARLAEQVRYSFWERVDDGHIAVRFAAGWSTTEEDIAALAEIL